MDTFSPSPEYLRLEDRLSGQIKSRDLEIESLQGKLVAVLKSVHKTGQLSEVILEAESESGLEIKSFWVSRQGEDRVEVAEILRGFSKSQQGIMLELLLSWEVERRANLG